MSEMAKFRKKPVIIEAIEWDETQATLAILENLGMMAARHSGHRDKPDLCQYLGIATLEGVMSANKGDWIIRGIKGEFYPCKPDIFAASYESAFSIWRAALEDRQEAPMDQDTQEVYNSLNVARYHELQDLRRKFTDPELKEHAIQLGAISMAGMNADLWSTRQKLAAYLEQNFRPRVPSEATPSKENAPTFKCKVRSGNMGANDPQECDWPVCGCDPYADKVIAALQESGVIMDSKARTVPVGTPQKETPPISEEVAAWRALYPLAEFASVTKGAQGKEPQFEDDGIFTDPFSETAYRAGEAAGRCSAITELKALQPDGYAHRYHDGIRYGVDGREINGGKPIEAIPLFFKSSLDKLCAELQETK